MTIARLARPEIRALKPYQAAQQVDDTVRLNANEAPWSSAADHFRRPLNRYPEIRPAALGESLAGYFGCDADKLLVTRGTSEAIDLLIRAFCREGQDNIVTTAPTFSMYGHYATVQGAKERPVVTREDDDFAFDIDEILDACDENSRLIFLCSPNNPTGTVLPRSGLTELLERRGDRSAIVVDEAYIEFSDEVSAVELLPQHENLIVLRTLSKALAFAGARCGAVMGPLDVVRMLNAIQAPYAMSTPVVECVEDALEQSCLDEAQENIAAIRNERERLTAALRELDIVEKVWPSAANFFLTRVTNADAAMRRCGDDQVLLRDFGGNLAGCIRITVGSAAENDRMLDCFRKLDGGTQ
jgi:histidinol-phosphate aminotransferase